MLIAVEWYVFGENAFWEHFDFLSLCKPTLGSEYNFFVHISVCPVYNCSLYLHWMQLAEL